MTKEQAEAVAKSARGWDNVRVERDCYGDYYVFAVDPKTRATVIYDDSIGKFITVY